MKTRFLFPRQFRRIGWTIFIPALIAAILLSILGVQMDNFFNANVFAVADSDFLSPNKYLAVTENPLSDEILLCLIVIGGIFAGFSKLRDEDEMIARIRYESLVWAVYFNFAVMLVATMFVYGFFYLNVMMINMFSLLFFFLIRFELKLYGLRKSLSDEE